ncbi:MAG: UxaA family hydrolase [Acidobacteria bacterium]|nr:UxaA family hydrolase [Acidobacteriota bacterium]
MIGFIVHAKKDQVGVVVRDITKGEKLEGWVMEDDSTVTVTVNKDIPLGHKVAINSVKKGERVIKYGVSIGKATGDIAAGDHVHTHNLKTERW